MLKLMVVSSAPHIWGKDSTHTIMRDVLIALVPALLASIWIFGIRTLAVTIVCVGVAMLAEDLFERATGRHNTVNDLSAAVTGTLLAFCLPADIPYWVAGLGSVIAIVVVKQLFGGIGQNFANPAITARVILLLCGFGGAMTTFAVDGVTAATPLADGGVYPGLGAMLLGTRGGSLGETCTIALLLGGAYLLYRRVITWHIPVTYLGTVFVVSLLAGQNLGLQMFGGGLMLGAFFMATDYTTSPMTDKGKLIYGVGCGLLTMMIRLLGSVPEGVSYAILLMNILTPHIDRVVRMKPLGGA